MRCTNSLMVAIIVAAGIQTSTALAGLAEYQAAVRSEPTLISYYTIDADTTAVADTAGANNGTLQGTATFTADGGGVGGAGKALSLDGSGWVNFGQVAAFAFGTVDTPTDGAVEMWIKPGLAGYPYDPCLAGVRNGNDTRWSMHLQHDRSGWGVFADGGGYHPFHYDMTADGWYHVVFQFAPEYVVSWLYTNGLWYGDFFGLLGSNTDQFFQIGSSSPSGAEVFTGLIDEVAVYSNFLPDETIARHYELMNPTPTTPLPILAPYKNTVAAEPSLIALYDFEGDTTQVTDKKGSVNGTLMFDTFWSGGFAGGQALDCTVGTGFVSMGPVPAFAFLGGTGSLEAWVAPSPGLGFWDANNLNSIRPSVLSCADDFDNTYYAMEVRPPDAAAGMEILTTGGSTIKAMAAIPGGLPITEHWDHLVCVFNNGQTTFYINGQQVLTQALPLLPTAGFQYNFQIGAVDPLDDWVWMGKIDEVAIYGGALSSAQVFNHYAAAALTFSVHQQEFVLPASPISVNLSAPTGQVTSAGQVLTFSYDPTVISVTATLPTVGTVTVPNGPITLPAEAAGLSTIPMTVTPIGAGFTNLTVVGDANWPYGDIAKFHVSVGSTIVEDNFDDGNVTTNTNGPGGGWDQYFNGMIQTETNSNWVVSTPPSGQYDYMSGGIRGKSAGTFQVMTPDGAKIEWIISNIDISAPDNSSKGQFPGGELADCRHELGIVSIDRVSAAADLFNNDKGGLYIDLFYDATAAVPTQTIAVTGNVRAINKVHTGGDGEGTAGLETVATFTLPNLTSITPATPLTLSATVNQSGWTIAFANNIAVNFSIDTTVHPGLSVANGRLSGGWDANSLNDAAITTEFDNGADLNVLFQDMAAGRGDGSLDYVKVCVGCQLATDCPDPFADINGDNSVDQTDFGLFQQCWTGPAGGVPDGCRCVDHNGDGKIDLGDLAVFLNCWSGPAVPAVKTCDD